MPRPTLQAILAARRRLRGVALRTPLERSTHLSAAAGHDVYLKLECWQRTRSFKLRGAYNAIASLEAAERARGVVAASAGNHGQGLAMAARLLEARATVFVPASAPELKKSRIRDLGAELRVIDGGYDAAEAAAREHAAATGAAFVHPCSDVAVVAGQATVGLEIVEDLPEVAALVVPVGGGGLIGGIGAAMAGLELDVRLHGVQSERTRTMHDSLRAGRPVPPRDQDTLADGLAGGIDEHGLALVRQSGADVVLVREAAVARAIRSLYVNDGVVAEGAGAVAAAALTEGAIELRGPTVLVISGGNMDADRLGRILVES